MSVIRIHNVHELESLKEGDIFVVVNDTTECGYPQGVEFKVEKLIHTKGTGLIPTSGFTTIRARHGFLISPVEFSYRSNVSIEEKSITFKTRYGNLSVNTSSMSANTIGLKMEIVKVEPKKSNNANT